MLQGYDQALCALCGTAHGRRARERVKVSPRSYIRVGIENHWDRQLREFEIDKPFGVTQGVGKGGRKDIEYFGIDDPRAEPFLEPIGKLSLLCLKRYLRLGLITKEQVMEVLNE